MGFLMKLWPPFPVCFLAQRNTFSSIGERICGGVGRLYCVCIVAVTTQEAWKKGRHENDLRISWKRIFFKILHDYQALLGFYFFFSFFKDHIMSILNPTP